MTLTHELDVDNLKIYHTSGPNQTFNPFFLLQ